MFGSACGKKPSAAEEVASVTQVPRRYLHRVMRNLASSGLVESRCGSHGGYLLARPAEAITILDVVNAVEPIGDAFQALFKTMKDNGFHEVRLLDATGDPYDPDNEAKTDFEKKAVKALLDGKPIYEKVVKEGDKRYLLSATPIPVVMEKCTMCHSSYEGVKGPIGALGLKIPLE